MRSGCAQAETEFSRFVFIQFKHGVGHVLPAFDGLVFNLRDRRILFYALDAVFRGGFGGIYFRRANGFAVGSFEYEIRSCFALFHHIFTHIKSPPFFVTISFSYSKSKRVVTLSA